MSNCKCESLICTTANAGTVASLQTQFGKQEINLTYMLFYFIQKKLKKLTKFFT